MISSAELAMNYNAAISPVIASRLLETHTAPAGDAWCLHVMDDKFARREVRVCADGNPLFVIDGQAYAPGAYHVARDLLSPPVLAAQNEKIWILP